MREERAALDQRRVYIPGPDLFGPLAAVLHAWTERLGHRVETDPRARESVHLQVLPAGLGLEPEDPEARFVTVSVARTSAGDGAAVAHLEGHHGLLDVAFVLAEHLFSNRAEQRRYGLTFGRLDVHVLAGPDDTLRPDNRARLVGLNRCGTWIAAPTVDLLRGDGVELALARDGLGLDGETASRVRLRGRIVSEHGDSGLVGLELALDRCEGLCSLRSLARRVASRSPAPC